ncbi:hypothetical protein FisN_4Hh139 [Fistulifera solaris]|uniref:Multidrug resistance protein, MATE family n=1 Tax=Fistulifera solaris TaxID=1519565 RepID=A0A1Z5JA96_FISSO|nr:hypothetical protein FisN_4Hh139 [Fistulifera solaris]|eukprot:GAX10910.1 hypothetical protein FisN_4Hh139 [Fistulifera solaris]
MRVDFVFLQLVVTLSINAVAFRTSFRRIPSLQAPARTSVVFLPASVEHQEDDTASSTSSISVKHPAQKSMLEANSRLLSVLAVPPEPPKSRCQRFWEALPGTWAQREDSALYPWESRDLDRVILNTAIPSIINMVAVPVVNAVDTFWVGRLGIALALAGQAAANQAFFTIYFLVNYLPTITAPLVASAVGSGNEEEARNRVCESLFLSNLLGIIGTLFLVVFPLQTLRLVLPAGAPATEYAAPYLRVRAMSMVPVLISATGFAAFRGLLDTVTPLKVSMATNMMNLILDPLMIFFTPLKVTGAAVATAVSEIFSGFTYTRLLLRQKLIRWSRVFRPPSKQSLAPLLQGSVSMLGRQLAINVALVAGARRAQTLDPTGVAAAAHSVVMQLYTIGILVHVAIQGTAATLVPSTLAKSGEEDARRLADRILAWGSVAGILLGVAQFAAAMTLAPFFSTVPEVQEAVKVPAILASILHVINGPGVAGEGILLGLSNFRELMMFCSTGVAAMIIALASPLGKSLEGVFLSFMLFCGIQGALVVTHYLRWGKLAVKKISQSSPTI